MLGPLDALLPELASPLGLTLGALCVAAIGPRGLRRLAAGTALVTLAAFSTGAASQALLRTLEGRTGAPAPRPPPPGATLVLLGGGLNPGGADGSGRRSELGRSGDRLALAAELYRSGRAGRIIVAAGDRRSPADPLTEADATREVLVAWGVAQADIILERSSTNTYENARQVAAMLDPDTSATLLLVTSAFHQRRARGLFCHVGLDTEPHAANRMLADAPGPIPGRLLPTAGDLATSTLALHEHLGILVYRAAKRWVAPTADQSCAVGTDSPPPPVR